MSEAETVLVTGATGTVGSVVARVLAENGVAVRAVSRRGLSPDPGAKGIDARAVALRDAQAVAARVVEQVCRAGVSGR